KWIAPLESLPGWRCFTREQLYRMMLQNHFAMLRPRWSDSLSTAEYADRSLKQKRMQILRNEIRTGILVILTIGLTVGIVLYLSAPGLFRPIVHYRVFFDDAAAIKPGASVLLAGRKIGT